MDRCRAYRCSSAEVRTPSGDFETEHSRLSKVIPLLLSAGFGNKNETLIMIDRGSWYQIMDCQCRIGQTGCGALVKTSTTAADNGGDKVTLSQPWSGQTGPGLPHDRKSHRNKSRTDCSPI